MTSSPLGRLCVGALVLLICTGLGYAQRKQGRNIPVGSDTKATVNFDCPEEFGYYPHPTDCTQYYVCVFGGALLESCTGGLMYSHELQTCDWPRNVGCDGIAATGGNGGGIVQAAVSSQSVQRLPEQRVRYMVSTAPSQQPAAVVSSRGQSRQLQHHTQEIISKQQQQQQLYADAEDVHPAEEIESDRQQRVYRGQPSTVGQVQRDRDGLRHTNAIPSSTRGEKIGVISFGTQQQQPIQQYRNGTFYNDHSLTKDLTENRRRKRQIRHRLLPIDSGDSTISWHSRHVPNVQYQQTKQTYHNHERNSMDLQPYSLQRAHSGFKSNAGIINQQPEYSAILSQGDESKFQPFSPKISPYKVQVHNLYSQPEVVQPPASNYQYYNYNVKPNSRTQFTQNSALIDNYSYFNLGNVATTTPGIEYASSNQDRATQTPPVPNRKQTQYYNEFQPVTNAPSQTEYVKIQRPVLDYEKRRPSSHKQRNTPRVPINNSKNKQQQHHAPLYRDDQVQSNYKQEPVNTESIEDNERNVEDNNSEIKSAFPSPPSYFYKTSNKYDNIENPFANPDFDFDTFISKLQINQESQPKQVIPDTNYQTYSTQTKRPTTVQTINSSNFDLKTPAPFSILVNKKPANTRPLEEDYYYDDDEENIKEDTNKSNNKYPITNEEYNIKPVISNPSLSGQINRQQMHKTNLLQIKSVTVPRIKTNAGVQPSSSNENERKQKPIKNNQYEDKKQIQDDYEYYDDYDYPDSADNIDNKQTLPKRPQPATTKTSAIQNASSESNANTRKPISNKKSVPPNRATTYETVIYQNEHTPKVTKTTPVRTTSSYVVPQRHSSTSKPRVTTHVSRVTVTTTPKTMVRSRQPQRLPTTTLRPNRKPDTTDTRNKYSKTSSRLEESTSPQPHSSGTVQYTGSSRTLYNGSQHYDPAQYDPYYTLYEDDVELYRDVDYTQQQQYTSNRAQQTSPQHTYRGTPAPIAVPVQSTVQEEPAPQRNTAYVNAGYSTQAQDVYQQSVGQDYQEDNYNAQVDDQTSYRQSSRQPSRGDRNELNYFVESTPKSTPRSTTTTVRTTVTTTTTTTPRSIPVQKQSAIPSRSPVIATANQTRPKSIIITLSATAGQKNHTAHTSVTDTTNKIKPHSTNDNIPSRFISLSTGFSLTQKDNKNENLAPSTYKPRFQHTTTTDLSTSALPKRNSFVGTPFSLTQLPTPEMKSVIFKLTSRLGNLTPNVSDPISDSSSSQLHVRSTENPKREITIDKDEHRNSLKNTNNVYIASTSHTRSKVQRPSVTSEKLNTESTTYKNYRTPHGKPIKTESTTFSSAERTATGRKIISKIHFGFPQSIVNPKKINNLATTTSNSFISSSIETDYDSSSQEVSNERTNVFDHYSTNSNERSTTVPYTTTNYPTTARSSYKFSINSGSPSTTERGNKVRYTPKTFENNNKYVPSTSTAASTSTSELSKPLYYYSSTTERHVPSTSTASTTSTTSIRTTTTTTTTSTTTTTASPSTTTTTTTTTTTLKPYTDIDSLVRTDNYRAASNNDDVHTDTDSERVRTQLFANRNAKPFRATAEVPSVSEILAVHDDEQNKKELDSPPTYKPKPFQLSTANDANQTNKTVAADQSRNFTIPARVSRVNTAIKSLIAFGGTRRNSQSSKCNENQTTPDTKCNEIQKQRTTSTRGRGSAHYISTGDNSAVNRGSSTSRSRPTLKPSTSIVSKAAEFVDIYKYPPHRPEAIYPQPQVDKTAAKCRKDVCLLPDCSCGGKEIPGDLPVEQVPQIVLLTFDDSVNDLNKGLYSDLFEKGRTNPNGCPIAATFYVSHEWTDYSQVQNLYSDGHEIASHTVSHSFGEQFSQKKWNREVAGQREILAAYGGVHLDDVKGMRAPFLSVGGNKMFKMLYDSNFTYDSSLPVYENRPPSWPYTLDYKLFHDCMIPPCPTRSYPGVWEVPMVMWQDLNGGRCSMGDACSNPPDADGVYKMLIKNFERHYTTNRAPFGLFYHAAWFTQPHHKEGFIRFLDFLVSKDDVFLVTNWQAIQWVREPTPMSRIKNFAGFQCNYSDRPKRCNNPKVCNLWHKSGVRYMKTCQPCPDIYPWTGKTGIRSSRIDNDIED